MTPVSPSSPAAPLWTQRLVEQLQLISEVSETLTYRLLELEERLVEGERALAQLRAQLQDVAELPASVESWLEETDERLARIEGLLRRGEVRSAGVAAAPPLKAVPPVRLHPDEAASAEVLGDPEAMPHAAELPCHDEQIA